MSRTASFRARAAPSRAALAVALLALAAGPAHAEPRLDRIELPPGFAISLFAEGVTNARSMALAPGGVVFVSTRTAGKVHALVDADGDGRAEKVVEIAKGLRVPNGVAFRDGALYVAEISRILRYDGILAKLDSPPEPVVLSDTFPEDIHHGWKHIQFGPDGWLYVPVGAPCNICDPSERHAVITRLRPDGSGLEVYARGVRNSVGMAFEPETGALWFTDNGRDRLGDDVPPDELNRAPKPGLHFGYPYCHGREIADPELGGLGKCGAHTAPAMELGPHVAALGLRFYTGEKFPEAYRGDIFIAEHGSWNRSKKIGYRVARVQREGERATSYETFASGWLDEATGEVWGRPVDVLVMPDGAMLVSDDMANAVYRIDYTGAEGTDAAATTP
jgi:glucose/arabinose dehydrogenase